MDYRDFVDMDMLNSLFDGSYWDTDASRMPTSPDMQDLGSELDPNSDAPASAAPQSSAPAEAGVAAEAPVSPQAASPQPAPVQPQSPAPAPQASVPTGADAVLQNNPQSDSRADSLFRK